MCIILYHVSLKGVVYTALYIHGFTSPTVCSEIVSIQFLVCLLITLLLHAR